MFLKVCHHSRISFLEPYVRIPQIGTEFNTSNTDFNKSNKKRRPLQQSLSNNIQGNPSVSFSATARYPKFGTLSLTSE
jgi:hypothetical protein